PPRTAATAPAARPASAGSARRPGPPASGTGRAPGGRAACPRPARAVPRDSPSSLPRLVGVHIGPGSRTARIGRYGTPVGPLAATPSPPPTPWWGVAAPVRGCTDRRQWHSATLRLLGVTEAHVATVSVLPAPPPPPFGASRPCRSRSAMDVHLLSRLRGTT